jgi:predicted oxidoreductase
MPIISLLKSNKYQQIEEEMTKSIVILTVKWSYKINTSNLHDGIVVFLTKKRVTILTWEKHETNDTFLQSYVIICDFF